MEPSRETVLDELLVLEAQGGDERAFAELVNRWQPRVLRHALALTERHDLAADAAQEAWIAAAKGIRRLDDPACFPRWLLRIVSHKCADALREVVRRRKLVEHAAQEMPAATPAAAEPLPGEVSDEVAEVRRALGNLSGEQRSMLAMIYWDGLSIEEIAHVFSIPVGTVKSRLHAARRELKQILERSKQ